MSIRFIYGRAGSGKSTRCLQEIKKRIEEGTDKKLILMVPEQFSFQAERNLLRTIGEENLLKAEVLSFKRMAHRVFNELGGVKHKRMNDAGKSMLLYSIIEDLKEDMTAFKNAAKQQGFTDIVAEAITEFKKYNITPEILINVSEGLESDLLKDKIKDLSNIYNVFQNTIHKNYIDPEDELTLLSQKLEGCNMYHEAEFWFDEFTTFTPQQYGVIERLMVCASNINIALCMDSNKLTDIEENTDIFDGIKNTEKRLLALAETHNLGYLKPLDLNEEYSKRYHNREELSQIERHFFSYPYNSYKKETNNIRLYKALNNYEEIENVAKDILRLVREGKDKEWQDYRFRDIAVVCRDIDNYEKIISVVFREFGIPYFMDKKRDVMNNALVVLITSVFDIFIKNWSYDSIFRYLKSGLTGISMDSIDILENYVLANGIKGKRWTEEEFWKDNINYSLDASSEEINADTNTINIVNETKDEVVAPLLRLQKSIKKDNSVRGYCTAIYDFLVELEVLSRIEQWCDHFSSEGMQEKVDEYEQIVDLVIGLLDQMVEVMGEEKLDIKEFIKILNVGFLKCEMGLIPVALDQVTIGDIARIKTQGVKAVYIVGVNDGIFPRASKDEGILSDIDRITLKEKGIELAADTKTKAFEEQFLVYTALTLANDYMMLSYPLADFEGKALRPSVVVSRLKKIIPKIKEESEIVKQNKSIVSIDEVAAPQPTFNKLISALRRKHEGEEMDEFWQEVYHWYEDKKDWREKAERVFKGLDYNNQVESINSEKARNLYGRPYFSVSRLEKYAECPFAYFVQYGLKAKDRKVYELTAPDLGSFMHEVIDNFSKYVDDKKIPWEELSLEYCRDIISKMVDEKLDQNKSSILNSSAKYKYIAGRLKRILTKSVSIVSEQMKRSNFKTLAHELVFGKGEDLPPLTLTLPSGEEMQLRGRIDRVDALDIEGETYIRIIDYKSGSKQLDLSEVYYGLQIQLLIYLEAILQNSEAFIHKQAIPGAIFYFKIDDPIISGDSHMQEEEIKESILKKLKLKGLLLNDVKVVKEMDKTISGYSLIIPARLNKGDSLGKSNSLITREQFDILREYVRESLVSLCDEMLKGDIKIKPSKNKKYSACDYCSYAAICQFDPSIKDNSYRYVNKKKDEDVWNLMKDKIKAVVEGGKQHGGN
ncbi:helicase-exonuclease AddAB subunit AddB [Desnuesiella massiliensis]|uniref:helicase-exonuclease AddAB subunit AddB n=1 Tax=Desnuesiella massiliensis TaxID=1650662 RepID=UPI0006E43EA9|nr:helicase-exonuclease AddAB subunit AddB [Desnuesiella massiliensis]